MKIIVLGILILAACKPTPITETPAKGIVPIEKVSASQDAVIEIVKKSTCKNKNWKDRNVAPIGYFKGMGLTFAKNYCSPLKTFKIKGNVTDALSWYGKPRDMISLFTLLTGLGVRESTGKYCCGRDTTNPATGNPSGAEAGTFQTSYDAIEALKYFKNPVGADEMKQLISEYQKDKSRCFLATFKEGVDQSYCAKNAKNYGSGPGYEYQKLSKECPSFHAEFTALTILTTKAHHGPLNRKEVQYDLVCEQMFKDIAAYLDTTNCSM